MSYIKQGETATLFATFQDVEGVETVSSTTPKVTVKHIDEFGTEVIDVDDQDMTLISGTTGQYFYQWDVAEDAYLGNYSASYTGTIDTKTVTANETITVLEGDYVPPTPTPTTYCATTLQIARFSGIGVEVQKESMGTGDGSDSYDTKNGNVIDNSYTMWFGDVGSNDLTELDPDNDYYISLDDGRILLTSVGKTKVDGKAIYIDYTYSPKQSDTLLSAYLPMADAEAEKLTGNYWGEVKTSYQFYDGSTDGYVHTDRPFGTQVAMQPEFELKYQGIQTVTSIEFLDNTGAVTSDVDSEYIRLVTDDEGQDGRVIVTAGTIPNGKNNVKITYTHGYDETPALVQELCALLGGVRALVNISGGSYKDISGYSIGRKNFQIGQIYVNVKESISQMNARIEEIVGSLGYRFSCA